MQKYHTFSKELRFKDLCHAVQYCSICSRLFHRSKVLTHLNGNINSKALFVAEAPGRLGADRTGIPLHGDRTGDIFESLINHIGWKRNQIFVTNAVLCNPREENGNNGTPTREEISNCSIYLKMTIELIQPDVVVPLGITALEGLAYIYPHSINLKNYVGKLTPWNNRFLYPLYHPGPRALIHRPINKQRADYMRLSKLIDPAKGFNTKKVKKSIKQTSLHEMVTIFIKELTELSFFKLTKLLYLTDLMALKQLGRTLSSEIYLRQQEGPWLPKLKDVLKDIKGKEVEVYYKKRVPHILIGPDLDLEISLDEEALSVILNFIKKYGAMNDTKIKSAVYLTTPMRYILKQEKIGRDMRKVPVIYKDKISVELDNAV